MLKMMMMVMTRDNVMMMVKNVTECDIPENFDTNEYPNIFVSKNLQEWIAEYICINKIDTNECPNKYRSWKLYEYSNIHVFTL